MLGFLLSPAGGWVTSAPRKMTGSLKTFGLMEGRRMELTPPKGAGNRGEDTWPIEWALSLQCGECGW